MVSSGVQFFDTIAEVPSKPEELFHIFLIEFDDMIDHSEQKEAPLYYLPLI